ncbi:MAG: YegS/Rv2252/BmrU family lipid kinase [Tissierellia bacterium]|nr:YegS/Rv2252/BmrU family lipid kinase [Tissierellia bacterium]
MRHIFIINPIAGKGKDQDEISKKIHSFFKDNPDNPYEVYYTKFKGDAALFIKDKSLDLIPTVYYACGGDGTLNEIVNAACNFDHLYIGVIPCGSGNDFIKNFNNIQEFINIESQFYGQAIKLDLINVADKYAVSVCNIGLDADAAFNMHKFKKIPFLKGTGLYILSVLVCLFNKLGKELEVTIDDKEKIKDSYLLGVIANGHSYGGGYKCAPLAKLNDGILDLCFVKKISRFKILSLLNLYKAGEHLDNENIKKYVSYRKCKNIKIRSKEAINLCMDGESFIYDEVNIDLAPNALNFWLPKGASVQN